MTKRRFRTGDRVSWNSEAGRVSGRIVKVITSEIQFKGYTVHASDAEPQTDHIAIHKCAALTKLVGGKK
jgi:Hypervirulence associated proteins TUDOR domain